MLEYRLDYQSPNYSRRVNDVSPCLIVLHYTGMKDAAAALTRLCDPTALVSAHYTVDEAGPVYQHIDDVHRAWHAGTSAWREIQDINSHSIGIEIVNPGHDHGYKVFPEQQIHSVIALCQQIQERYKIDYVLGHSDVAPDRKIDPGELFPWQTLARHGVGLWPAVADEHQVKAQGMNIATALHDFGYRGVSRRHNLIAFQRHFVPEAFERGTTGAACPLTRARLYALLAGHVVAPA